MKVIQAWITSAIVSIALRPRGRPLTNSSIYIDEDLKVDFDGHRSFSNQSPVSSLQYNASLSVQPGRADNGMYEEPTPVIKRQRIGDSGNCGRYPELTQDFFTMDCMQWAGVMKASKNELCRQAGWAVVDLVVGLLFAEVPTADGASAAGRQISVLGSAAGITIFAGNESTARAMDPTEEIRQRCTCRNAPDVEACVRTEMNVFDKITKKHAVVNATSKVLTTVAIGAPLVGFAIDVLSGGSTCGTGTATGGTVSKFATIGGGIVNGGHLAACTFHYKTISSCFDDVCNGDRGR